MCGIGTITLGKTARTGLDLEAAATAMLLDLVSRGEDATGMLTITAGGRVDVQKAVCDAATFNKYRRPVAPGTRALAVHTRFATQGPAAFNRNNHPVSCGPAMVVHNGVVWEHERRKPGQPEVDTYVLAQEANAHGARKPGETAQAHAERVASAMAEWDGSAAVGVAFRSQPFLITARLYGSPLYVAEAEGVRVAASTRGAVLDAFLALDIDPPTTTATRTETVRKAKRGRGAKTRQVTHTVADVVYAAEGTVLAWSAGSHSDGRIVLPYAVSAKGGYSYGEAYAYGKPGATKYPTDHDYASIAERMIETGQAERCELCDEWHDGPLATQWGMRCCSDCIHAMRSQGNLPDAEDDPTAEAETANGASVVYTYDPTTDETYPRLSAAAATYAQEDAAPDAG